MDRRPVVVSGQLPKEVLDPACRLVDIDDSAGLLIRRGPPVRDLARQKHAVSSRKTAPLGSDLDLNVAANYIDPFVLLSMQVPRSTAPASELKDGQGAVRVLGRHLTIVRFIAKLHLLSKAALAGGNRESGKHFFAAHLHSPFQVPQRVVDGFDQSAGARDVLYQNLPMGVQRTEIFKLRAV